MSETALPRPRAAVFRLARGLSKHVVVVDRVVMTNVAEFDMVGTKKFEDDAIGAINPKAPDFMMFGMQFLAMKGWMKRILSKEIGLGGGFPLNRLGEFLEQTIEGRGRREFEHDRLSDQLS